MKVRRSSASQQPQPRHRQAWAPANGTAPTADSNGADPSVTSATTSWLSQPSVNGATHDTQRTNGCRPKALVARVVAAHGGAGATTLASHLADQLGASAVDEPAWDAARRLVGTGTSRANGDRPLASWGRVPAVVVASGTASGTRRAMAKAAELRARYGVAVVVAIVADGPLAEPIAVRARLRAVSAEVDAVVRVPYVPRWRFEDEPSETPARYRAAVAAIASAITQASAKPSGAAESKGESHVR